MKPFLTILGLMWALVVQIGANELEKNFAAPPDSAKPHVWWHWMEGSVTKAGITADLEAMQRVGLGGATSFNLKASPVGPVKFLTPEWRELMQHAASEAARLGLKFSIHNCTGWSSSGGPWNTPANAMQRVTISETTFAGPGRFAGVLPQPPTKLGFYRDIAVLAVRRTAGEDATMSSRGPKASTSQAKVDGAKLIDGQTDTYVTLPLPTAGAPQFAQVEFARPFLARSLTLSLGPSNMDVRGVVQVSDDGRIFRDVRPFEFPRPGTTGTLILSFGAEGVTARTFRCLFTVPPVRGARLNVAEIALSPALRIEDIEAKSGMLHGHLMPHPSPAPAAVPADLVVSQAEIIDLTSRLQPDGRLEWEAPAGPWVILRLGHTPTGVENRNPVEGGGGLECDKMSTEALDIHWKSYVQKVLDDLGPLAGRGRTFDTLLIDSYEVGGQNWTPKFRAEFQRRRGYDPLPFMVTLTGRVVASPEFSERFLWDWRRTISDLFAENYYGRFRQLCNERGLAAAIEPYSGPYESLQIGAQADLPMGEFWVGNFYHAFATAKLAASVGHVYGRPVIGAESFTAFPSQRHGRWLDDPYALKASGDFAFCVGVNRLTIHRWAHQPWTDRTPGMTMGHWGTHFDRTVTWFEQGSAWMRYLTRCQHLLRQGRFVADAAYFYGEGSPMEWLDPDPALPAGYDYDGIGADVLLRLARMADGRLTLPSGMAYRVLVLPAKEQVMTPTLLRQLQKFVTEGLTLVGPPPRRAPGLGDYPRSDEEVRRLARELWGEVDGQKVTERAVGRGSVVWGRPLAPVLTALRVPPDFEYKSGDHTQLAYIHRRTDDADLYFVSHQRERFETIDCTFRVAGKVPELWYPDSGRIVTAGVWHERDGRITLPLALEPSGSVFVVFRRAAGASAAFAEARFVAAAPAPAHPPELRILRAAYEALDGSGMVDVTERLQGLVRGGALRIEAVNVVLGEDPARFRPKRLRVQYALDGVKSEKTVGEEDILAIGPGAETAVGAAGVPAPFEVTVDASGRTHLRAWSEGVAELRTAAGQSDRREIRGVPAAVELAGPWELSFPPNWGAPARVTLPKLISWSEHPEPGVKYFSGTATYTQTLEIAPALLEAGCSLWLDLGEVKNLAEVAVNGKPLGILWKPPFRVDLTRVARPGKNTLEIKVTNLWPNRLIGDEQLPPDREWTAANQLKSWPQWLLDGKPSPTGRFTFTTWHHWKKDDALLPSGLLGPVMLRVVTEIAVEP